MASERPLKASEGYFHFSVKLEVAFLMLITFMGLRTAQLQLSLEA